MPIFCILLPWVTPFLYRVFLIYFEIYSKETHIKEKAAPCRDSIPVFNDRYTRMFRVFLNSFFNWIWNIREIADILLINFNFKMNNANKEITKNICYFYSFLINSFYLRQKWQFGLTWFKKSSFTPSQIC